MGPVPAPGTGAGPGAAGVLWGGHSLPCPPSKADLTGAVTWQLAPGSTSLSPWKRPRLCGHCKEMATASEGPGPGGTPGRLRWRPESPLQPQPAQPLPAVTLTICFSVYLLELSRFTASMCPKSMSWPKRKMKSNLQTYFFLL